MILSDQIYIIQIESLITGLEKKVVWGQQHR